MKGITMITLERTSVMNMENALRGARNPLNSWNRTDSFYDEQGRYILGPNDLNLAKKLRMAGSDHRKDVYKRQASIHHPQYRTASISYDRLSQTPGHCDFQF